MTEEGIKMSTSIAAGVDDLLSLVLPFVFKYKMSIFLILAC